MRLHQPTVSFERDQQFAVSLLTLLRHRGHTLPPAPQATLIALATEPFGFGHPRTQEAIKALLSLHPVLAQSVALDETLALAFLPVCIWAAEQKGNAHCGLRTRVLDWKKQFSMDSLRTLENSLRALNVSYALRDEFSDSDLRVLAGFWQDENKESLGQKVYTLGSERYKAWCDLSVRLGLFHEHLASVGIKEDTRPGQPAWHLRWAANMGTALEPMTTLQQSQCIEQWLKSDLSDAYVLRACKQANPSTWLIPEVSVQLSSLLPNSEVVRWKMLPWSQKKNASNEQAAVFAGTNQAMLRAYCPLASKVLDVVTTPDMWRSKKTIDACMAQFAKNAPQVEELPHAGDSPPGGSQEPSLCGIMKTHNIIMTASPFPLQTTTPEYQLALGARLVTAFEQEPAAQAILRRVLCLGSVPKDLPPSMLAWMHNFPSLHPLCEELSQGKSMGGPVPPVAVALGPLLAWASRQEWANEVAWEELLTAIRHLLGVRPPAESVADMVYALRVMQPMHSVLAPERRTLLLDTWLQPSVLWQMHRWTDSAIYSVMAQAWVLLGLLAENTPFTAGSPAPLRRWQTIVKKTLYAVMPWEQTRIITVLLGSALSDSAKAQACCSGDPESLDDPDVVRFLTPCLHSDEAVRIGQLAWASPVGSLHKSGSPRAYMPQEAVEVNTRMVQAFCPMLYSMLTCVVPAKAWAEKHLVAEHVKAFLDPTAQDIIDLPMDLGLEEVVV